MATKFSQFTSGGDIRVGDKVVGLRDGDNFQFNFPGNGILDANGNYIISYSAAVDGVNYVNYENADTGASPKIETTGQDATIGLDINTKGNGNVSLNMGTGDLVINGSVGINEISNDPTLASASNSMASTSLAVKTYVDNITDDIADSTFITKTNETAILPNSIPLSGMPSGFLSNTTLTGGLNPRTLTGTPNEISVSNGTGILADPTFSLPATLIAPGTFQATTSLAIGGAGATVTSISTDGTMAANSDTLVSTQKAVKTYADAVGGGSVTLTNAGIAGGTTSLVNDGTGPALAVKGVVQGQNISVTTDATDTTVAFTGTLPIANGGTNNTVIGASGTVARSDGARWVSTTATYPSVAGTASTLLRSNGTNIVNSTPTFPNTATSGKIMRGDGTNWTETTATFANTYSKDDLLYASSPNVISGLASTSRSVLGTSNSGVLGYIPMTNGQLIIGSSAGQPAAGSISVGAGLSITPGSNTIALANTLPDQTVVLTGAGQTTTSGTYPNFTITTPNQSYGYISMNTGDWTGVTFAFTTAFQELRALTTSFTLDGGSNNFEMTSDGRLKYTGIPTVKCLVSATFQSSNSGNFAIQLRLDGVAIGGTATYSGTSGNVVVSDFPTINNVATNDYFSIFAKRSAAGNFNITHLALSARTISSS